MNNKETRTCPSCGHYISVINGKIIRHEKGLAYVPYRLYHKITKMTEVSVKELVKRNLCKSSGVDFNG